MKKVRCVEHGVEYKETDECPRCSMSAEDIMKSKTVKEFLIDANKYLYNAVDEVIALTNNEIDLRKSISSINEAIARVEIIEASNKDLKETVDTLRQECSDLRSRLTEVVVEPQPVRKAAPKKASKRKAAPKKAPKKVPSKGKKSATR